MNSPAEYSHRIQTQSCMSRVNQTVLGLGLEIHTEIFGKTSRITVESAQIKIFLLLNMKKK